MTGGIPASGENGCLTVVRYGRFWAVYDNTPNNNQEKAQNVGRLVCLTVYKKGAREVVRRLEAAAPPTATDDEKGTR